MSKCFLFWLLTFPVLAQSLNLYPAPEMKLPAFVDSNSPAYWYQGNFYVFNSNQIPVRSQGSGLSSAGQSLASVIDRADDMPMWIEAARMDDDGTLYAWYHHEQSGVCPGSTLNVPEIGALVSYDQGATFRDLGIVLSSGYPPDCSARNGFFAGGNGDFSVILDQSRQYFYFLFDNYGGPVSEQGVAIARMNFADRTNPTGAVWKYYDGDWTEPGFQGRDTPIFPAAASWEQSDTDSFWGPSIHWNTYLGEYVVFMNRSCCSPKWPQKGIYVAFNFDVSDPGGWTAPDRILQINEYYPQVIGLDQGGTDTLAGRVARFFVGGTSNWEITFLKQSDLNAGPPPPGTGPPGLLPLSHNAPR